METIKRVWLNEIPSYIKQSQVYFKLIEHNVKQINLNKIPLFILIGVNKMTFDDFIQLLRTIYFWNIPFEQCPIELFIYISKNLKIAKDYIDKYSNELTKFLQQLKFDNLFLESAISKITSFELLKYVIENNLRDLDKLFCFLCIFSNTTIIKYMFNKFSNKIDIHHNYDYALRHAAKNGHLDFVECLLENGANIHAENDYALLMSAENGHLDVVKFLLKNGADIHAANDYVLPYAAENGHLDVVEFLLKNGVDIHANNDYALRYSAQNGHLDVVKFLLEHGADIHAKNDFALRYSVEDGLLDTVKLLLQHSLDIEQKFSKDKLLEILKEVKNNEIKNVMEKYMDEN